MINDFLDNQRKSAKIKKMVTGHKMRTLEFCFVKFAVFFECFWLFISPATVSRESVEIVVRQRIVSDLPSKFKI